MRTHLITMYSPALDVLVVEDDEVMRETLCELLRDEDYQAQSTPSGLQALKLMARRSFNVVLLDIDCEDLSGLATQRAVRDFSAIPSIIMSARDVGWRHDALYAGASACLRKPFHAAQMMDLVRSLVVVCLPASVRQMSARPKPHKIGQASAPCSPAIALARAAAPKPP